jgi:type IV pilus assembly protein PilY1
LTSGDPSNKLGNNWALGQEAWAFIPDNLLPHLRWLADKNYTHVFYVDGSPVVSDVQLWGTGTSTSCQAGTPASTDIDTKGHVCGWGTVMVVPFHLGGGMIQVDTVGNATAPAPANNTQTSNSAYVIMDVTDPEQVPTVMGEITTGTFTLGAPAFAVHKETGGALHFLLTIGSGPADNGGPTGTTTKPVSAPTGNLGVWVYDLANFAATAATGTPVAAFTGTSGGGPANSFAGDMVASDFDLDDSAESVYFGVVTNPPTTTPAAAPGTQAYGGGLWKLNMNSAAGDVTNPGSWSLVQVINTGQPVTIRPTVAVDSSFRKVVYFGTGRAYTSNDLSGTNVQGTQQQDIYGVSDNSLLTSLPTACQTMPSTSTLFNSSSTSVTSAGGVSGSGLTGVTTMAGLEAALTATVPATGCYVYSGWVLPLAAGNDTANAVGTIAAQQPSERVISSQTLFGGILLTPTYTPPNAAQIIAAGSSSCNPIPVPGTSNLYGVNYLTGTADSSLAGTFGVVSTAVNKSISLGTGIASSPVLHVGNGNVSAAFGIGGGTQLQSIKALGPVSNGEISWREPVDNQ